MCGDYMKKIDIICPLYNAEQYIDSLHKSLLKQENVIINKIRYVLTESSDKTEDYLKNNNIYYKLIKLSEFSHSYTRECEAFESDSDIVVFITQDVVIDDSNWLYELTKDLDDVNIVASYSKQISKYSNIEKYTREFNYPDMDRIVSKDDINVYGLRTFFFSDAASAISTKVFKELNGYDQKRLPISEDMYIAYKIIMNGYKIKYCANSVVYHSHRFTLKQIYNRYKLTGKFFKENDFIDKFNTNKSGKELAFYILKRIFTDFKLHLLFRYPFDMAARLFGMKAGKR